VRVARGIWRWLLVSFAPFLVKREVLMRCRTWWRAVIENGQGSRDRRVLIEQDEKRKGLVWCRK
jgi:hypothetical protein